MKQSIEEFRRASVEAAGGTSDDVIKAMVLGTLEKHGLTGKLLDFGAGKGELLKLLAFSSQPYRLTGADYLSRPADLPSEIGWIQQDLNDELCTDIRFDAVICSEVIEHLENPRAVFRNMYDLIVDGGHLVLTMPNQESIRSYAGLLLGGHFVNFLYNCYPAHITALLRLDLIRICRETGFGDPQFYYSNEGGIPKLPHVKGQGISCGVLRGRLFSDNIGMIARKHWARQVGSL